MARPKKSPQKVIVTRIAKIGNLQLNSGKLTELNLIAKRCGLLRSDIWNEYGSLKAWGINEYAIDKLKRPAKDKYQLPAKLWEATLYDVIGDIHLAQASCIEKVLSKLNIFYRKAKSRKSPEQLLLESREWLKNSRLSRLVRSCWVRGHTHVANQIVIKEYDCQTDKNGVVWLKFGGLTKGKPLKVPTTLPTQIKGQIRLIKQGTDSESITLRCKKIQIYPSLELKLLWNKWLAACRYCYNQAIAYQKEHGKKSKLTLRTIIMNSDLPERKPLLLFLHSFYCPKNNLCL